MIITKRDIKFFNFAKTISNSSTYKKHKLGCVIVYRKQIISVGWNDCKTCTTQARYNKFRNLEGNNILHQIHAETMALKKIRFLDIDFSDVELYVYREHRNGVKALAKPCKACQALITSMGISIINYTIEGGYACERIG